MLKTRAFYQCTEVAIEFLECNLSSIDAQEEDGMNQGTEPTSKKKQKKEGLKHTTQIEDLSCGSKNAG
jgi:hypothetical protein